MRQPGRVRSLRMPRWRFRARGRSRSISKEMWITGCGNSDFRPKQALQPALARHDAILGDAIERHGGQVFKTVGDAFYATFPAALDALEAALAAQRVRTGA